MNSPETPPKTRDEILKGLGPVRWLRSAAIYCLLLSVGLTLLIVLIHRVKIANLHFFVDGSAWTHHFWKIIFYLFILGWLLAFLNIARVCPRCERGFFKRQGYRPDRPSPITKKGYGFGINTFSRQCLNCGLRLDGSNVDGNWEE